MHVAARDAADMTGTLINLIVLVLLLATVAACALAPLVAFALILRSWRRRESSLRVPRGLHP